MTKSVARQLQAISTFIVYVHTVVGIFHSPRHRSRPHAAVIQVTVRDVAEFLPGLQAPSSFNVPVVRLHFCIFDNCRICLVPVDSTELLHVAIDDYDVCVRTALCNSESVSNLKQPPIRATPRPVPLTCQSFAEAHPALPSCQSKVHSYDKSRLTSGNHPRFLYTSIRDLTILDWDTVSTSI